VLGISSLPSSQEHEGKTHKEEAQMKEREVEDALVDLRTTNNLENPPYKEEICSANTKGHSSSLHLNISKDSLDKCIIVIRDDKNWIFHQWEFSHLDPNELKITT
jgi:hypothetical protein